MQELFKNECFFCGIGTLGGTSKKGREQKEGMMGIKYY
jgi:hypothetical protein